MEGSDSGRYASAYAAELCPRLGLGVTFCAMSVTQQQPTGGQSAGELNARIRALMIRSGGFLDDEQRREYAELLEAWAIAVRRR